VVLLEIFYAFFTASLDLPFFKISSFFYRL